MKKVLSRVVNFIFYKKDKRFASIQIPVIKL